MVQLSLEGTGKEAVAHQVLVWKVVASLVLSWQDLALFVDLVFDVLVARPAVHVL
jgi:hypothetical protein